MSKLRKLTFQEVDALNRFINSDRTSDKTKQAFIDVLNEYKPTKEELNKEEIEQLETLLTLLTNEEDKKEIQEEIDKLRN